LHATKPAASNLFGYLNEVTPANVSISSFHIDFAVKTATITGAANTLSDVNKYIDTLKFTTFSSDTIKGSKAFSDVVLSSFGLNSAGGGQSGKAASYSISLTYGTDIFDIAQKVKLKVPSLTTTRSALGQPSDLFQAAPDNSGGGN
jgi:hypothetical protein